jgi:hypothetical protein
METNENDSNPYESMGVNLEDMPLVSGGVATEEATEKATEAKEDTKPAIDAKITTEETADDSETTEEAKTDLEDGKPETESEEATSFFKAENGREYKDVEELGTAFENSSKEAIRLNTENKETKQNYKSALDTVDEQNKTIMALQDHISESGYPDNKTSEEIEAMSEEDRYAYYREKSDWKKEAEGLKEKIKHAKEDNEAYNKDISQQITANDTKMAANEDLYPGYTELKDVREYILEKSPFLANRPEMPYITYVLAEGLTSLKAKEQGKKISQDSRSQAANKAKGDASVVKNKQPSSPVQKTEKLDEGLADIASAFKAKNSGF